MVFNHNFLRNPTQKKKKAITTHDKYSQVIYHWAKVGWNWCSSFSCYNVLSPFAPYGLLYENMMSSTKPEVHYESQSHHIKAEPPPEITQNLVELGHEVSEIFEWTDRQTYSYYAPLPGQLMNRTFHQMSCTDAISCFIWSWRHKN